MTWRLDRPLLLRAAALLLGGAALGLVVNAARPGGVAVRGFEPPTTCASPAEDDASVAMTPREAAELCSRPGAVFADTRTAERFAAGHVAGAIHLPCDATASGAEAALKELGQARTVVVYGDSTEAAQDVAETLRRRGVEADIRILRGGFGAWEQEGLACASGPCRGCSAPASKEPNP